MFKVIKLRIVDKNATKIIEVNTIKVVAKKEIVDNRIIF